MKLVELVDVEKNYYKTKIFNKINVSIEKGDKVALIGENGVGKSTFLKIILKDTEIDSGSLYVDEDMDINYFDQFGTIENSNTVIEILNIAFKKIIELEQRMYQLQTEMASSTVEQLVDEYDKTIDEFEALGGYSFLAEKEKFIDRFGLNDLLDVEYKNLSGGERQYLRLALALFNPAELIILDEPLTFFDQKKTKWLASYIQKSKKTFIVITHDIPFIRYFANKIFDIDNYDLLTYSANYDEYLREKEQYIKDLKLYNEQKDEIIAAKYESIIRADRWKETAADGHRLAVMTKRLARQIKENKDAKNIFSPNVEYKFTPTKIEIDETEEDIINIRNLEFCYEKRVIFKNLNFVLKNNEHIMIIGPNAKGKTTFLKLLQNQLIPQMGSINIDNSVRFSYIPQDLVIDEPYLNLFEYTKKVTKLGDIYVEDFLEELFSESEFDIYKKTLSTMSGGEKKRLQIACSIISDANVLLIDEPTTFMDQYSKQQIIKLIDQFKGSVIVITHDQKLKKEMPIKCYHLVDYKFDLIS